MADDDQKQDEKGPGETEFFLVPADLFQAVAQYIGQGQWAQVNPLMAGLAQCQRATQEQLAATKKQQRKPRRQKS